MVPTPRSSKWKVNFEEAGNHIGSKTVPDPPGLLASALRGSGSLARGGSGQVQEPVNLGLKQQALYTRAGSTIRTVGFMCFIQWMSGNTLQIFSIMTMASGIYQPLHSILTVHKAFPADPEGRLDVSGPRALFCIIQLAGLLFSLWKLDGMGLLPTHASDWISATGVPRALEFSARPIELIAGGGSGGA